MRLISFIIFLCCLCTSLRAGSFSNDFAVVFIDAGSEAKYGIFPVDRSILASAIVKAKELQARAVILKFFVDLPRKGASDALLSQALTNLPVVLQANLVDAETNSNPLPERFYLPMHAATQFAGERGMLPLPIFSANAHAIGFIDFTSTRIPLLETFKGRTVKSLFVCAIELAIRQQALITPGEKIAFGRKSLALDPRNSIRIKLPARDDLSYIPFDKFLSGEIASRQIRGKVVIMGYDGPQMHSFQTPIGPVKAHRLFVYALQSLYDQFDTSK
ncbi:MAG TPA: CHASE2 domain-containing protein [Candidatus Saccharimonadales bacterium]|nr:CHASE2 domain-containing protein [Candidatus Saccharimonadales bacterium]